MRVGDTWSVQASFRHTRAAGAVVSTPAERSDAPLGAQVAPSTGVGAAITAARCVQRATRRPAVIHEESPIGDEALGGPRQLGVNGRPKGAPAEGAPVPAHLRPLKV
jgi:hypothetical protein